jgi:subtilase family serine protease
MRFTGITRMTRSRTITRRGRTGIAVAVAVAVAALGTALVLIPSSGSEAAPNYSPIQGRSVGTCGVAKTDRVAALATALGNVSTKLASGVTNAQRWGSLDLRDIYSYHVDSLWKQGVDGCGTAVAVLEGWEYPNMQSDLNALDAQIGLPDTTVETVYPNGPLPAVCPPGMVALGSYGSCTAWQGELRLDVEAVHLMAPYAKIVISATPSDSEVVGDPSSEVAMPEIVKGMEYLSTNKIANVMSISDGSSETDYSRGAAEIHAQDVGELTAAAAGVPIANATGDCGAAQNLTTATRQCGTVSSGPASATWADSPWVTAIGGSTAQRTVPCPPCTDPSTGEDTFVVNPIEGAGLSEMYPRPSYQTSTSRITGSSMRSMPDITMNSADGTSEAAPLFAGVLALATQMKGSNLGPINEALYKTMAQSPSHNGLIDVKSGNNTFNRGGIYVPGYTAAPGYDVATGWGTVDASKFVPALAKATRFNLMPSEAYGQLTALQRSLSITPSSFLSSTATIDLTDTGFLPGHPVTISVDGNPLATVTVDTAGNWSYSFTATDKGLAAGKHTLTVHSLLLDQSTSFRITS